MSARSRLETLGSTLSSEDLLTSLALCGASSSSPSPLLVLSPRLCDPHLGCQPSSRIVVRSSAEMTTLASLRTHNGEIVREEEIKEEADVKATIQTLVEEMNKMKACRGFSGEEGGELFDRIRKTDIPNILIEKQSGRIIYRSRNCAFVVDSSLPGLEEAEEEEKENPYYSPKANCIQCISLVKDLDLKYFSGRLFSKPEVKEEEEEKEEGEKEEGETPAKRRRGRPKGSKNKSFYDDFVSPDLALKDENEENEPVNKEEEDDSEDATFLAMKDDPEDEDYGGSRVRKSGRKRKINRHLALALGQDRKRGRPPIITAPQACEDCGKTFTMAKEFKKHRQEHTNNFPCELADCTRRFRNQTELDVHLRKHRGEKPFVCSECDKAYTTRQDLKLHLRNHTDVRPWPCPHCDKSFKRVSQRDIHLAVHTGVKAFLCSECGNSFGSVSTLIDHKKRKHLEMRDHKCTECPKGFFTRQELAAHARTHTGDKPFLCKHCGKSFSRTHHLKRHLMSVHKENTNVKISEIKEEITITKSEEEGYDEMKEEEEESSTAKQPQPIVLGGSVLKLQENEDGETVLVAAGNEEEGDNSTTTVIVSDLNGQLMDAEYLVDGQRYTSSIASDGTPMLIQKVDDSKSIQYATLSGDAASSLIELSQVGVRGEDDNATVVVEIPEGEEGADGGGGGGYILVTTEDQEQKLVPVSQFAVTEEEPKEKE